MLGVLPVAGQDSPWLLRNFIGEREACGGEVGVGGTSGLERKWEGKGGL